MRLEIVVTLSAVTACAPAPDRARFTVDYYRAHAEVRAQTLAQCVSEAGGQSRRPDCVNAREAERMEGIGSLRSMPPLGLPPATGSGH
jgi:hypothetical protein